MNGWQLLGRLTIGKETVEYFFNPYTREVKEQSQKETMQSVWEHERFVSLGVVLLGEKQQASYMDLFDEARRKVIEISRRTV